MALIDFDYFSAALSRNVKVKIILPVDQVDYTTMSYVGGSDPKEQTGKFKTVYLLHGIFDNQESWLRKANIYQYAQANNLAVVMPNGDTSFYADDLQRNILYGKFIGEELVDITRKAFPLSHQREATFIAGLSMGGYGALRNGLAYPETFAGIGAFSSAIVSEMADLESDEPVNIFELHLDDVFKTDTAQTDLRKLALKNKADLPKIFMACGTEDSLLNANRQFADFLKENQIAVEYVEDAGGHTWEFWDKYFKVFADSVLT